MVRGIGRSRDSSGGRSKSASKGKSRSAITGKYVTRRYAKSRPNTTVTERKKRGGWLAALPKEASCLLR